MSARIFISRLQKVARIIVAVRARFVKVTFDTGVIPHRDVEQTVRTQGDPVRTVFPHRVACELDQRGDRFKSPISVLVLQSIEGGTIGSIGGYKDVAVESQYALAILDLVAVRLDFVRHAVFVAVKDQQQRTASL